jgi:two-component system KDP operon response regulator KdpE
MAADRGLRRYPAGTYLDLLHRTVTKAGEEVHLTPKEYAVLSQRAKHPGRMVTHQQIMVQVWPNGVERHVEYLRVLVRTLRKKLERDPEQPQLISNELGVGYRLKLPGDAAV